MGPQVDSQGPNLIRNISNHKRILQNPHPVHQAPDLISPGFPLSSFGKTHKSIKINFKLPKKKLHSTQHNVQFVKTYGLQEAHDLAAVILVYKVSKPFHSSYSKRDCVHVLLTGFSHSVWKQLPETFLQSTICQGNMILLRHRLESWTHSLEKNKEKEEWMNVNGN